MNVFSREVPSLHAAALVLGAAALLSKLIGLLRDRLLAARFGAGETLDTYYAAFQIPDILFTLFLAGAASAAVLPVLLDYERRGPGASEEFLSNLLTVFSAAATVLAFAAFLFAPWIMAAIAPGFDAPALGEATRMTRIMVFNAVLLGVAGIFSSVLQARHRFFVFALPPIVYNLGIIAGILWFVPWVGTIGLAYGVLLGGALQVLVQLPALRAIGFRFRLLFRPADVGLLRVVRTSLPRVAAIAMSQVTIAALTAIASFFASGSISVFRFAANLLYVPVGLFGVSWAMAAFPKLSGASLERRGGAFREQFAAGVRGIFFWAFPSVALLVVLRAHIVRVALGSGVFDWEDTRLVAAVLAVLAVAAISESVVPLLLRAFYALGRTREPLLWDVAASLLTVALALGFSRFFQTFPAALERVAAVLRIGDLAQPAILAVAIAFAIGSLANALLLARSLRKTARIHLGVELSFGGGHLASIAAASVLGGAAAYLALLPFPVVVATNTLAGIFLQGAVAGAVGLFVYGLALAGQGNPEVWGIVESFRRRLLLPRRMPAVYEAEKFDGDGAK